MQQVHRLDLYHILTDWNNKHSSQLNAHLDQQFTPFTVRWSSLEGNHPAVKGAPRQFPQPNYEPGLD